MLTLLLTLAFANADCLISSGERKQLLALNYNEFDQSPPSGGWRKFNRDECKDKVAEMIKDYAAAHPKLTPADRAVLIFHVGQMYADLDRYPEAIAQMKRSLDPRVEARYPYWNKFVAGTIAFLQNDGAALAKVVTDLRAAGKDDPGYFEVMTRFEACLGRPYRNVGDCPSETARPTGTTR